MSCRITVHDDQGIREYSPADLPLQIGGVSADVRVDGVDGAVLAQLGIDDGVPFLSDIADTVRVNGDRCGDACWLPDGSVAVFDDAHLVCAVRGNDISLHVRSRVRDLTPAPAVDDGTARDIVEPVAYHPGAGGRPAAIQSTRALKVTVGAVFLTLGIVAWFLFTARSVDLVIEPMAEQVDIEGALLTPRVGGRYLLRPGRYEIVASRSGYETLREDVTVGTAGTQQFVLDLKKLPGKLSIDSGELTNAQVFIDGENVGVTPLTDAEVPAGLHRLVVTARNHLPFEQEIDIAGMGAAESMTIRLQPNWAPVSIVTTPPGARVAIGGNELGMTPLRAEVEAGEQNIEIVLPGYKPVTRTLTVVADEAVELPPIELTAADGTVAVRSDPAGASVTVDGEFRGRTPVDVAVTPGEGHTIALARPGYASATRRIELAAGKRQQLDVTLTPILGTVRIVANPADAEVVVDGRTVGTADQVLSLTAAPHTIEVRKRGYAPHVETITPRQGLEQQLTVVLKTIAEAEAARLDATITSVAGQTLRLMPVGTLQLGSPRREQGRRSNEVRRDVELTREFYVSESEVTNGQLREFMSTHSSGFFGGLTLDDDNQPVARLAWQQAARYCNWLSEREGLPAAYIERDGRLVGRRPMTTGYRLPTEAEWAWVARFEGGARPQKYVWGDNLPPPQGVANLADNAARSLVSQHIAGYDDGHSVAAPVGSFAANRLGLHDLGGNVAEWTHDYFEPGAVDPFRSFVDPVGPESGNQHVIRGQSWKSASITELRSAYRDHGAQGREDLGFRIARYAR